jgi:hypothetical protein
VCELVQHVSLSADKRVNWRCYRLNATLVRPKAGSEYVAGIDNMRTVLVEPRQYDEEENEVSLDITLVAKSIDSIGYMADRRPNSAIRNRCQRVSFDLLPRNRNRSLTSMPRCLAQLLVANLHGATLAALVLEEAEERCGQDSEHKDIAYAICKRG